jgi:Protein of unknown function (DUF2490)
MVTTKPYLFATILLLICSVTYAQPTGRDVVNQSAEWLALSSTIKVHKHVGLYLEGQFRFIDFDAMQFQSRAAVDVTISKHFSIVPLGYVYTWNFKYGKQPASIINNEHRTWQQVTYKHHISRLNLSHRVRLEQRFIQVHTMNDDQLEYVGYDLHLNRIRYRFMTTIPLNSEKIEPKTIFASLYDEAFLSWGKGITFNEPDQNRVFIGAGYQVNKAFNYQLGFFYQMLIKSNGAKQENNIGFQLQVNYNFDLTKSE